MILRLITAPIHSGKSTLIREKRCIALAEGLSVGGFLTLPVWEEEGKRKSGFLLELLPGGEQVIIASADPPEQDSYQRVGRFYLHSAALAAARRAVEASLETDITVMDEIGPAELAGEGHRGALEIALEREGGELWLAVRSSLLAPLLHCIREKRGGGDRCFIEEPYYPGRGGERRCSV